MRFVKLQCQRRKKILTLNEKICENILKFSNDVNEIRKNCKGNAEKKILKFNENIYIIFSLARRERYS